MFNEAFSDLGNQFQLWLQANNDASIISNVRKSYFNRAQRWLQLQKPWEGLVVDTSLTVSDSYASLPSDYISLIAVGHSVNSDGDINFYYNRMADGGYGYRPVSTFTKAAGQSWRLQFFTGYPLTPNVCRYQKKLDDFEDNGTTEYSFFPGELLLKTAQMLRLEEYEKDNVLYGKIYNSVQRMIKRYRMMQYNNSKMKWVTRNDHGNRLSFDTMNLSGENLSQSFVENDRSG